MAYTVGLIATDGCLIERGRSIAFVSQDAQLVETLLACLGREPRYRTQLMRLGRELYRFQFKAAVLYRWLEQVGLTPRKSLTLGSLLVRDLLLPHFVRGFLMRIAASSTRSGAPTRHAGRTTGTSGSARSSCRRVGITSPGCMRRRPRGTPFAPKTAHLG